MLGHSYFSHRTLRTVVSVFGSLFDDIFIVRKDSQNNTLNQEKVPIRFAPKQSFLGRLEEREDLDDVKKAITYQRMSFDFGGTLEYDSSRITGSRHCSETFNVTNSDGNQRARLYSGIPYKIPLSLYIVSKNRDDVDQIVEQILPFFRPSISLKVKSLPQFPEKSDEWKLVLNGITFEDNYNNDFVSQRQVIYTLSFDFYIWFYRSSVNKDVIKQVELNFKDFKEEDLIYNITYTVNPFEAEKTDVYTINTSETYGYDV